MEAVHVLGKELYCKECVSKMTEGKPAEVPLEEMGWRMDDRMCYTEDVLYCVNCGKDI